MPIDARSIDAGFRELVAALVVAFIDEDLVIDQAGNDDELGAGDVLGGEGGVVIGRRLRVARADGDIGRNGHPAETRLVHAERLDDAGRHGERRLDARIAHIERGRGIERQLVAKIRRHRLIVLPALLEGEELVGIDLGAADPERGEAALRMAGDADAIRVDRLAPHGVLQQKVDGERDVARPLPDLVGEVSDRLVVSVGAIVIEAGHDIALAGERLGEPGILQRVRAAPMREHHQRITALAQLGVPVEMQIGEEGQAGRRRGFIRERGRIEHGKRDMPVAIGEFDLLEADGIRGLASSEAGRRGEQKGEETSQRERGASEAPSAFQPKFRS